MTNALRPYILLDVTGLSDTKPQRGAVQPICVTVWRVYYQIIDKFNKQRSLRK